VSDFIKRGNKFVLKTDIKDFFETIDHNILKCILKEKIENEHLINLIMMYLKIGAIKDFNYEEHKLGVYQGNIISPMLSNIYLDKMDKFLEKHNFDFVRFADDFVILTKTRYRAEFIYRNLSRFLKLYKLSLNYEKTYITSINSGFSFLGVYFTDKFRTISEDRVKKIKENIFSYSKLSFDKFIEKMNFYYYTLKNYYLKISPHNKFLKSIIIDSCVNRVYLSKLNKEITNKKEFRAKLDKILFFDMFFNKTNTINLIITRAYNKFESVDKKIESKKRKVVKKLKLSSIIHLKEYGLSLGVNKNKIVVKKYGKILNTYPIKKIERIICEGKGFSISSNLIYRASKEGIYIDFLDTKFNPYASLHFHNISLYKILFAQTKILNTPKQLELAKSFVYGKIKNQKNYLVYRNKYYKELDKEIKVLKSSINKIKYAKTLDELRGIEGSSATIYWNALSKLLKIEFRRVTYKAKDKINSALNYGYAILYGRVQYSLIKAGLNIYVSYLHSNDVKPTLVYDLIEEFRTFIVDREIVSMINRNEKIEVKDGLLTNESKKLISKNIFERLASFTAYKKKQVKVENIIFYQAQALKKAILEDTKYKPFIGRY